MSQLGIEIYRFSIEWARLMPQAGQVDEAAIDCYRRELLLLREKKIRPLLTIHHFTNPMWFEQLGGFTRRENLHYYLELVELVAERFGDLVSDYITINEPNVYATNSFFFGQWPPGEQKLLPTLRVMENLAYCHIRAYEILHRKRENVGFTDTRVGCANHLRVFAPKNPKNPWHRLCANIGMYIVMVAWQPVTQMLGDTPKVWFWCAVVIAVLYLLGLLFPLLGIKSKQVTQTSQESTSVKQMFRALLKNDQLMWTTLAMGLFMVGYCTTVNFAIYYMKYEGMYVILVGVVGVAQLGTLSVYPLVAGKLNRRSLYTLGTVLVLIGYAIFFFAEISIVLIALGAVLVFVGQAFIQTLMLMFLADTVECGQWKLGKRNESITFSIQPLINKIGAALATGIVSLILIFSGIKIDGGTAETIDSQGKLIVKIAMFAIPLIMIVLGYIVYLKKYKVSEKVYAEMLQDLETREAARTAESDQ